LIDSAISKLRSKNEQIFNMNAFDLVELSHRWYAWKSAIKYSENLSNKLIKEDQIYYLN
jgi:hypothetical protein